MAYPLLDSFKRKNNKPLDEDYIQSDFFGNALGDPSTRNELCINSPNMRIGLPFWDENTQTAYLIVDVLGTGDTATWVCDTWGSGTGFTNVALLKKLSEAAGKFYYNGNRVALYSEIAANITYVTPVEGVLKINEIAVGDFESANWLSEDIPNGTYVFAALGSYFSNMPFTKNDSANYVIVLDYYRYGFSVLKKMSVITDDTTTYVNNSKWISESNETWEQLLTKAEAVTMIAAASSLVFKKEVSCIEELLLADETDGYGIPAVQHKRGTIIMVRAYDLNSYDNSDGNGRIATLRFIGTNTATQWNNIAYWQEIEESESGPMVPMFIDEADNLEVSMDIPQIMAAVMDTNDITIFAANYYGYMGKTRTLRIVNCTGLSIMFGSEYRVIQNAVMPITTDEIKIHFEIIDDTIGSPKIDVYVDNIPD